MVAYSFQQRFVEPIEAGRKQQTIRGERRRHSRPGELVQLYTGMRTKNCRLIGTAWCRNVEPIRLILSMPCIETVSGIIANAEGLDEFAQRDGFARWRTMAAFWRVYHPAANVFSGVLIEWRDFRPGKRLAP